MIWKRSPSFAADDIYVKELRQLIRTLPAEQPLTDEYERRHAKEGRNWNGNQKEHLIGWLRKYNSPGAYDRKHPSTSGRAFYNHFRCMPGLLWLAEALGEEPDVLTRAIREVEHCGPNPSTQCATFRKNVPWTRIAELVATC